MSFFGDIGNFFGNLFGGQSAEDKKKRDQQQQQAAPQKAPVSFGNANQGRPSQSISQPQQNQPQANGLNLVLPGTTPKLTTGLPLLQKPAQPPTPVDTRSAGQKEIDQLTAQNLQKAKDDQHTSWLDRNITDRGWEQRAEALARDRAVNQYQEKHGYNKQPEVMASLQKSKDQLDAESKNIQNVGHVLDNVQKGATKAAQIAQWIPVTGSVLNLGLAGVSNHERSIGNTAYANELDKQRNLNEFGMSPDQYDALDPETKHKLQVIRNVGYGLAPLDVLGLTGLAKSEGVNVVKDSAIQFAKEGAIDEAKKAALKTIGVDTAKNLAKTTAVGTGISLAGQGYLSKDPTQLSSYDPLEALKTGTMIAGTNELFNPTQLRKASVEGASSELHPGIHSNNPNQVEDAAKATAQSIAQEQAQTLQTGVAHAANDINSPAYLRKADKAAAAAETAKQTDQAARDMGLGDTAIDTTPAYQHKQNIQNVIDQGNQELNDWANANPGHTPQQLDEAKSSIQNQVVENIAKMQQEREAALATPAPRAAETAPVPQTPAAAPAVAATPAPAAATVAPSAPLQTSGEPTIAQLAQPNSRPEAALQTAIEAAHNAGDDAKVAELIQQLPPEMQAPMQSALGITPTPAPAAALPQIPTGTVAQPPQVPVAPRFHDAVVKQLGDLAKNLPGDGNLRDVTNLDQLAQEAQGVIENITPEELVNTFGTDTIKSLPNDAKSFAVLRAARDKLSHMLTKAPEDTNLQNALANVMDDMESRASGNGLLQRVVQEEFDNMPPQAKVKYLIKKIDAANKDSKGYEPLARDPAKAAEVEAALTSRLQAAQDVAEQITGLEDHLNKAADAATQGQKVDIKDTVAQIKAKRTELAVKNGEVVKYFQNLVPGRTKAQRALVDFPKRMMLASFSGRINDVLTTAANVAEGQAQNFTAGILAKGYNLIKGAGSVSDANKGAGKVFGGIKSGLQKFRGEAKGNVYVDSIPDNLKGVTDLRSGLRKPSGPVGRTVQAATELATNVTEGVRDQKLYQLADQEAAQLGLKGGMRKQYAEARAAAPSRQMVDAADKLHKQVNNLNDNPISRTLQNVGKALEGDSKFGKTGIGGLVKNQVIPFTSWLGGNIWNQVTDKNVVAQTFKFLVDAHRGDPEAAIHHLAGAINGGVQAYAIGYQLAAHGMLTDKNAEGYNDGGKYLHIGDRYIPVGQFGFFAPNIVLGSMVHDGMHSDNPAGTMAADIGNYAWHGLSLGQTLGVENNLTRSYNAATTPGNTAADGAAVFGGGVAGQYIPGIAGDANSVIDQTSMNPTHEAADTRVGKTGLTPTGRPSKAKDVPASALASLENRVPILSQQLPRKAGVASKDFLDRVTHGDQETQAQKDAKAQAKTAAEISADFAKRGVPDPNAQYKTGDSFDNAVENRIENGKYDQAIEGLQAQLAKVRAGDNVTEKQTKPIEDKIKETQVLKSGKFDPKIRDTYKSTSVSEWRNMGDPESDTYDPEMYQKLYDFDTALAKAGISGSSLAKDKNKFTAKKPGKGRSSSSSSSTTKSNTIGDMPSLGKFSLGDLAPQKAGSIPIPKITQIQSSDLIKKRKITVGKA